MRGENDLDGAGDNTQERGHKMTHKEAQEWLAGRRSWTNNIPQEPIETWMVRIEQADAAAVQRAYWIAKAHKEGLVQEAGSVEVVWREGRSRHVGGE